MKTRTQRYINKYCEYIDRFLDFWQNNNYSAEEIHKLAKKARFIHCILGIDKKIRCFSGALINPNIHEFYYDFNNYAHDPEWCKRTKEQMELREKHILECKELALNIDESIGSIESGAYEKSLITEEKIQELHGSLIQIRKAMDCNIKIDAVDGRNANRLLIELGQISKWLNWAVRFNLATGKILPYRPQPHDSFINVITEDGQPFFDYSDFEKKNVNRWIEKTKKLLKKYEVRGNAKDLTAISLRDLKYPIKCVDIAGIVRETSSNISDKFKRKGLSIVVAGGNSYCDLMDAKIVWPKKSKLFNKKMREYEEID